MERHAVIVLCALLASPLVVFIHELGHAVVALAVSKGDVELVVGSDGTGLLLQVGRLRMRLHPRNDRKSPHLGLVRYRYDTASPASLIAVTLAGPAASFAGAAGAAYLANLFGPGAPGQVFFGIAAIAGVLTGATNLLPVKVRGAMTDGAIVLLVARAMWEERRRAAWRDPHEDTSVPPPVRSRGS